MVGVYQDTTPPGEHGFVRNADGTYLTLDVLGAACTYLTGINTVGDIAGFFCGFRDAPRDFVRHADGTVSTFFLPGAHDMSTGGINNRGEVVGTYVTPTAEGGFLRHPDGLITTINVPGALWTTIYGIDTVGFVAGAYADVTGSHGFIGRPPGPYTTINAPGADGTSITGATGGYVVGNAGTGNTSTAFLLDLGIRPPSRHCEGGQDRANRNRILNGSDQTHSSAAARAGEHVDIERAPHQISPPPVTPGRPGRRVIIRPGDRARGHRRLNRRGAVGDHPRAPAGMGSRYILLRDRKKLPSTTAGTHSTARLPA